MCNCDIIALYNITIISFIQPSAKDKEGFMSVPARTKHTAGAAGRCVCQVITQLYLTASSLREVCTGKEDNLVEIYK